LINISSVVLFTKEMERGPGGRDDFGFGDPFAGFHHGFGRPPSLFPSLFGGQGPFDDPFFTQPFGNMMGHSMFGPSMFNQMWMPFHQHRNTNFIQEAPASNNSRGLVIRELDEEEHGEVARDGEERSTGEPHVQEPDDQMEGTLLYRGDCDDIFW
jgi:hypothetical protein